MTTKQDQMLERLDAIVAQLAELGVNANLDVPTTHLDPSGNPGVVSAGEIIESAWGNSVASRVVGRYPNLATLDTVAAPHGSLAVTNDFDVVFLRSGGTWLPTAMGNVVTFRCVGGSATIPPAALTIPTWSEEFDPFGVVDGAGVFHVPARWAGRWAFEWATFYPDGSQAGTRLTFCQTSARRLGSINVSGQEGGTSLSGAGTHVLSEGQYAHVTMYHTDPAGALVCNTDANNAYFIGHYLGPA